MRASIVADSRERESRLLSELQRLGVQTHTRRLPVADYSAGGALVERKSVRDLHLSIIQGRFWLQIGGLSRTARRPYLLVEGESLDAGPLRPASVRGALLAVAELGIGVIRASDPADSALWLKLLAERSERKRGPKRVYAPQPTDPAVAMLAAVPGISVVTAQALLARFGSIANLLEADPADWLSVSGVGPKRMHALRICAARTTGGPSRARSARPDPST